MAWYDRNVKMVSSSPLNTAAISARILIVLVAAHFMIQCLSKRRNIPYLLTYILTYLLHGAESFLSS